MKKIFTCLLSFTSLICAAADSNVDTIFSPGFLYCIWLGIVSLAHYLFFIFIYLFICKIIIEKLKIFGLILVIIGTFIIMLLGAICKF